MFPRNHAPLEVNQSFHISQLEGYTPAYLSPSKNRPGYYPELLTRFEHYFNQIFGTSTAPLNLNGSIVQKKIIDEDKDSEPDTSIGEGEDEDRSLGEDRLDCLQASIAKVCFYLFLVISEKKSNLQIIEEGRLSHEAEPGRGAANFCKFPRFQKRRTRRQ